MKLLSNGCSRSPISVTPKNWKTTKADVKKKWKIHYRFYDPAFPKGKQVALRGMNSCITLQDRQAFTQRLINNEMRLLDQDNYNPITGEKMASCFSEPDQKESYSLSQALLHALKKCTVSHNTRIDMRSVVKYFLLSADQLGLSATAIENIHRKDIRKILDNCENLMVDKKGEPVEKKWTPNQFNHYRKNLIVLFNELEELELVEFNAVEKIAKKETIQKIKKVLTNEERCRVSQLLKEKQPNFHRFVNIFFHSGTRLTELCRLQGKDVELIDQRFKVVVIKGKKRREVWKTIKDIALPFWSDVMKNCKANDYVFSFGLEPGNKQIRREQITRRWHRHIKSEGISADLYSLKHLNTTETVDQLGELEAARHNGHTSTAMVVKIYDVKQVQRKHEKAKSINNSFS